MKTVIAFWNTRIRGTERARDVTDAVAVLAVGLLLISVGLTGAWSSGSTPLTAGPWWHALPLVAICVVMLGKRRHPIVALAAGLAIFVLDALAGGSIGVMLGLIDLIYAAAMFSGPGTPRRMGVGVGIAVVAGTAAAFIVGGDVRATLSIALTIFAVLGTPLWWGVSVRQQRELAELATARADDLKRLAELREAEVVRNERTRMARDLHDALASNLSAIAIHSEAAIATADGGNSSTEHRALTVIRSASVTSLEEMRSMIMLLRGDEDSANSPARLAELTELVDVARGRGLVVTLSQEPSELPTLPSAIDQAAYRIIQEALTNAARHAPAAETAVIVAIDDQMVRLRVENQVAGPPEPTAGASSDTGLGLTTMRERAEALGGTFRAGPVVDGTRWHVAADLPLNGKPL